MNCTEPHKARWENQAKLKRNHSYKLWPRNDAYKMDIMSWDINLYIWACCSNWLMSLSAFWRLLLFLLFQGCGGWVGNRTKSVLTSIRSLFIPALIRSVAVTAMGAERDKSRKTRVVQQKQSESTSDHRKLTFTNNICNSGQQLMSSPSLSAVNSKHYFFSFSQARKNISKERSSI